MPYKLKEFMKREINKSYVFLIIAFIIEYLVFVMFMSFAIYFNNKYIGVQSVNTIIKSTIIADVFLIVLFAFKSHKRAIFAILLFINFSISFFGSCAFLAGIIWISLFPIPIYIVLLLLMLCSHLYYFNSKYKSIDQALIEKELRKKGILNIENSTYKINTSGGKSIEYFKKREIGIKKSVLEKVINFVGAYFFGSSSIILGLSFGIARLGFSDLRIVFVSFIAYFLSFGLTYLLLPSLVQFRIILNSEKTAGKILKAVYS